MKCLTIQKTKEPGIFCRKYCEIGIINPDCPDEAAKLLRTGNLNQSLSRSISIRSPKFPVEHSREKYSPSLDNLVSAARVGR